MKSYVIASCYKFISLSDYVLMKEPLLKSMKKSHIKGTLILAAEGINGSFCGEKEAISSFIADIKTYPALEDLSFQETFHDENPFDKAKVKLRKEIVTLGVESVNPSES